MLFFFLIPGQNVLCALLSHSSVGHYAFFFFDEVSGSKKCKGYELLYWIVSIASGFAAAVNESGPVLSYCILLL